MTAPDSWSENDEQQYLRWASAVRTVRTAEFIRHVAYLAGACLVGIGLDMLIWRWFL